MAEGDLLQQAKEEAEAIVSEAQEQARRLLKAAEDVRNTTGVRGEQLKHAKETLSDQIAATISKLQQILEQLRAIDT